ncbi:MAG: hypothetical protein ACLUAR_01485 [Pilosibacter sp.]
MSTIRIKQKSIWQRAYPNGGATLDVTVSGAERKTIAEMIQSQLKEIGIAINIVELDSARPQHKYNKG